MPNPKPFGHTFKLILLSGVAILMTACSTTSPVPTQQRGPVAQRPAEPQQPVVGETPVPETAPKEPVEASAEVETIDPEETRAPEPETQQVVQSGPYFNNRDGLTPPHMAGRDTKRLAILLPFSTSSSRLSQEAQSMYRAAEMAVFDRTGTDVLLFALDTKGTEDGARSATRAAVKAGADVILGPILAGNVKAAAREAGRSGTPLIAFSTDQTVAGDGTYLMSFPPEAEVARVVDYVASTGTTRFAYLGPDSAYGRRVKSAYDSRVAANDGEVTAAESYQGNDITVMQAPAQRLAAFHAVGEKAAKENGGLTPMSFEAILLPEGGTALRSLAPLLPYYDIDPADVQFMGTSRWADPDTVREPALSRGLFAGPDKDTQKPFLDAYDRTYGETATTLASLAYDAVMMGAFVADGDPRQRYDRAESPEGFYGVDGLVSFDSDGRPDRGLAVYQIQNGRFIVVDPAPRTVQGGT
jgi:ABC-type branched-subunit amino acid transport system substrate-binding protein